METKFTKGKWSVGMHNNVYSKYQLPIAVTYDGDTAHNSFRENNAEIRKANALLISKAPEMFDMLEKWSILNPEHYKDLAGFINKTKQLLKEATEL